MATVAAGKGAAQQYDRVSSVRQGQENDRQIPQLSVNGVICFMAYLMNHLASSLVREWLRMNVVRSSLGLYHLLTGTYTLLTTPRNLALAVIPILHSTILNPYIPSLHTDNILNTTLHSHGFSLLARQHSNTGYISVLDNVRDGFRVMRCDHSLLGGEWLPPQKHVSQSREPIYAIFVMLEAVRLVKARTEQKAEESALVIGLGIGTTPSALIAHGISTTILEIDPVVHAFATQYFNLPTNHTPLIQDATAFVSQGKNKAKNKYNYIIHDVFTGGAEPLDLFTHTFIHGLKELLTPDGVIAINYAGDLHLPTAGAVVHTILAVFPVCRLFREEEAAAPSTKSQTDFTNLVIFCRREEGLGIRFREPREKDFLGSQARKEHLLPRYEVDAETFSDRDSGGGGMITGENVRKWGKVQYQSAVGHWWVMRSVLPDGVWENW
ncbi:MAG: hypothetical protein Q9219_006589 [cf. Caloplaca sp. 3 TL-2023]